MHHGIRLCRYISDMDARTENSYAFQQFRCVCSRNTASSFKTVAGTVTSGDCMCMPMSDARQSAAADGIGACRQFSTRNRLDSLCEKDAGRKRYPVSLGTFERRVRGIRLRLRTNAVRRQMMGCPGWIEYMSSDHIHN